MTKTTPGPWRYKLNSRQSAFYVLAGKHTLICDPSWNNTEQDNFPNREESEANARLIAKAPTLLDMVQRLYYAVLNDCDYESRLDAEALLKELGVEL